jgi:hypothetical protein
LATLSGNGDTWGGVDVWKWWLEPRTLGIWGIGNNKWRQPFQLNAELKNKCLAEEYFDGIQTLYYETLNI